MFTDWFKDARHPLHAVLFILAFTVLVASGVIFVAGYRYDSADAQTARAPLPDEVQFRVFQYGTGDHELDVTCGPDGTEPDSTYNLVVDRPFEYRLEPRWKGGKQSLDVIGETRVFLNEESSWTELVHYGAQTKNRELAQIGQHVTLGRGDTLAPTVGAPLEWEFYQDFQLGSQSGPKLQCVAAVTVWRAGDPNIPEGAVQS